MTRLKTSVMTIVLALLIVARVDAQQPGPAPEPRPPGPSAESSPTVPGAPPAPAAGGMAMLEMCRHMMGDVMGMPMMGSAAPSDPKERADMLQMRGEMMKAMGDIMMKHARRMQGMTAK